MAVPISLLILSKWRYAPVNGIKVDLGPDLTTSVFRVCLVEGGPCTAVSHFDYPSYSRETFHVYVSPRTRLILADYAAAPRKATEDVHIIDHRKRMLQSFLNRLAQHPILRRDHVVHRFLTGDASWVSLEFHVLTPQNEVLHSPPISLLPKNILKAPPVDPASADGDQRYKGMLLPKQSGKLKV
jgi:hypothetical protein